MKYGILVSCGSGCENGSSYHVDDDDTIEFPTSVFKTTCEGFKLNILGVLKR